LQKFKDDEALRGEQGGGDSRGTQTTTSGAIDVHSLTREAGKSPPSGSLRIEYEFPPDSPPAELQRMSEDDPPKYRFRNVMEQALTREYVANMEEDWELRDMLDMFSENLVPKYGRREIAVRNAYDISLPLLYELASIAKITKGRYKKVVFACLAKMRARSNGPNCITVSDVRGTRPLFEEGGKYFQPATEEEALEEEEDGETQGQTRTEAAAQSVGEQTAIGSVAEEDAVPREGSPTGREKRKRGDAKEEEEDNDNADEGSVHSNKRSRPGPRVEDQVPSDLFGSLAIGPTPSTTHGRTIIRARRPSEVASEIRRGLRRSGSVPETARWRAFGDSEIQQVLLQDRASARASCYGRAAAGRRAAASSSCSRSTYCPARSPSY
jgi:hypothetical protein